MAYLIKIKDYLSDSECVTNKRTCLKNWKSDFLSVFKFLTDDDNSFIDLNIEQRSMNILKREKIVKKGYIYNTSTSVDKIMYSLSLIKFEIIDVLTTDASTSTITTNTTSTFSAQTVSTQATQTAHLPKSTEATQTEIEIEVRETETEVSETEKVIDRFENKYKYDDRLYPHDYFYSEDSCDRFDYFTKIYNPSYQPNYYGQEQHDYYGQEQNDYYGQQYNEPAKQTYKQDYSRYYYYPVPEEDVEDIQGDIKEDEFEEIDIRIDPCAPPKYSKQDLIDELKTKLYQPNYGLNYSNGYKLF